jgi:hypothetical protein
MTGVRFEHQVASSQAYDLSVVVVSLLPPKKPWACHMEFTFCHYQQAKSLTILVVRVWSVFCSSIALRLDQWGGMEI